MYIYIQTYAFGEGTLKVCMFVCTYVRIYVSYNMCVCVCICVYMYIYHIIHMCVCVCMYV